MNKVLLLCLALVLSGCVQSADTVQELTKKCTDRGGKPELIKYANNEVASVWCNIDGAQFRQGNY